ncbi:hypothetical protein [Sodalis sp. (in: enterobacteria)]|uniref:hypothetical protein n=1 Tax=Sodalis sp. (in: enterobacteria) TaxID=1898979 RepID=UPI003F34F124
MSRITTSISTLTSNVFTTSKCDKKNTKSSTSTFLKMSSFLSCVKNTPSQQSSNPSASSSSSKEKTRSYVSLEEAAKKEKGIKIEKKGQKTNVIISGVSGLHIGETYTFTPPKNKDS